MVARRALAAVAVLLAAAVAVGCSKTISGRGTLAEDSAQPASPTATSSSSESPSQSPSGSSSASPSDGGTNEVCKALDQDAAEKTFGGPVSFKDSQQTGCQIIAENGDSMIVAVFDFLTLAEYKHGSFKDLTVAGHPRCAPSPTSSTSPDPRTAPTKACSRRISADLARTGRRSPRRCSSNC